jgi:8-oxo-dGTP pyrophosphatase MutT (NUDIX family)
VAAVVEQGGRFLLVEEMTADGLKLNNPAGHLDPGETPEQGAARECLEETGYDITVDNVIQNIAPYEEIFMGSDMKCYKQKYFLAMVDLEKKPKTAHDIMEVGLMKWMPYDECIQMIRPYNLEKKRMITNIHNTTMHYSMIGNNV